MAKIISVVEKPIAENVSEEAYFLGIQDSGEGKQTLSRFPYKNVCRQLNGLTKEDIQAVKDAALGEVTEAAQNVQDIADDLAKRAADGEFNGKDYILTASDKTKIAEQAAELVGAMQGGTVTYKIPKEYYHTDFGDDPNASTLCSIQIPFVTATIYQKQLMEDIEAGIIDNPFGRRLSAEEQEISKKYISLDVKPWVPTPHISWFDFLNNADRILETKGGFGDIYGAYTIYLNKIWNNDFKVLIHAENQNGEVTYGCIKSDIVHSADVVNALLSIPNVMVPAFGGTQEYDEETGIDTVNLELLGIGVSIGYGSALESYTSYVTDDDVKEVTITFIPNNAYVEEYDDE